MESKTIKRVGNADTKKSGDRVIDNYFLTVSRGGESLSVDVVPDLLKQGSLKF